MCSNVGSETSAIMTRRPDASIVVCTYNRATSLRLTLDALDAQLTPADFEWELVVVDNNSTDATPAVVDDFAATARVRVRTIFVAEQGLSHARNAGVAHSEGHIVGFTDDDVHPAPDWVARIAAVMHERGADIIGGRILAAWRQSPPPWLEHRSSLHGALAIMEHMTPVHVLNPHATPGIWGANMAFRREVFDKVGLFDTRRGLVGTTLHRGEEIDLVTRALAAGYRAVYDPSVVVSHRIGADRMRVGYLSRLYFQRSEGEALVQTAVRGRALFDVALARHGSLARRLWSWGVAVVLRRPDTIERWLECCDAAGFVWGIGKRRFAKTRAER